jgi:hypothetical protein
MKRKSKYSGFDRMRTPLPPPLSLTIRDVTKRKWRLRSRRRSVLQFMNQLFLFSEPSGDNFRLIWHLPTSNRCWYQQFQTKGCLCKGKSAGTSACVRRNEWDSHFFTVRRNLCAMRVVSWRCRLWMCVGCYPIIFTWCSFFSHFVHCVLNMRKQADLIINDPTAPQRLIFWLLEWQWRTGVWIAGGR